MILYNFVLSFDYLKEGNTHCESLISNGFLKAVDLFYAFWSNSNVHILVFPKEYLI